MVYIRFLKQALANSALSTLFASPTSATCLCMPGEPCWPSSSTWDQLNSTVGGRLLATVPLGSPCHDPVYNETACAALQNGWTNSQPHMESSSSIMAPFFANQSCDPFTPVSRPCLLGNYVSYAVNVSCPDDVIVAVNFAKQNNIRLVIRNTGHDYLGKSTGAGGLAVWTHHLKDIDFLDWSDSNYEGKAIKMGAGVQGFEAIAAGHRHGLVPITGECPTVGVAGGYTQGGGHSALSTSFGLAADQVLEFKVVTADGSLVTASPSHNQDLYWALSGGGGGTFGVVVSMVAKVYPDTIVSGASMSFTSTEISADTFYQATEKFHSLLPDIVDAGAMVIYYFTNVGFQIQPLTAYNKTSDDVKNMLGPFTICLDELGITYNVSYTQSSTYMEHFNTYLGPLPYGNIEVGIAQYGGRLIPRTAIQQNNSAVSKSLRNITENGVTFIGVGVDVSSKSSSTSQSRTPSPPLNNSILPAWRRALISATLTTPWNFSAPWEDMLALQGEMTDSVIPQIEAVTPGSGAYMNEADFRQPRWQEVFFGDNYEGLMSVKRRWDPEGVFWARRSVGSETLVEDGLGRLCRV
ncbi:FAD/FMN-containing dehydrogenase [Cadophora sp. DSE1049]|nr:FAD/FMN-containing dehydrogenase [Cadophora sp. DSE1049]